MDRQFESQFGGPGRDLTMPSIQEVAAERTFLQRVFAWMTGGLALTGLVAWWAGQPATFESIFRHGGQGLFIALIVVELLLVLGISAAASKVKPVLAATLFVLYSAVNGLTLSVIFLAYAHGTIASAFLASAATFGACATYGYVTKKDLTSFGGLCAMGLIGIVIASVVNLFMRSSGLDAVISYIGVFVFIGLTAWDVQKLKAFHRNGIEGQGSDRAMAINGALMLYLDFINIFLFILRILGRRR